MPEAIVDVFATRAVDAGNVCDAAAKTDSFFTDTSDAVVVTCTVDSEPCKGFKFDRARDVFIAVEVCQPMPANISQRVAEIAVATGKVLHRPLYAGGLYGLAAA